METAPKEMAYPYTGTARFRNYPWRFYYRHNKHFRHLVYAYIICLPIFYKIQKLSYAPANVEKFEKLKREEEEHSRHKFDLH